MPERQPTMWFRHSHSGGLTSNRAGDQKPTKMVDVRIRDKYILQALYLARANRLARFSNRIYGWAVGCKMTRW